MNKYSFSNSSSSNDEMVCIFGRALGRTKRNHLSFFFASPTQMKKHT